jgi:hypothetical protein
VHNRWERVAFARSARKHKVGRARVLQVIDDPVVEARTQVSGFDDRLVFLGADATGRLLEVMAVELVDGTLLVIHAMDLRAKWRTLYEEGLR